MYSFLTVPQLKDELRKRNATTAGKKAGLIERVESYDRNQNFGSDCNIHEDSVYQCPPTNTFIDINTDTPLPMIKREVIQDYFEKYPIYQRGNPQLRVFLPNFWMKLVRPESEAKQLANVVQFQCSMEMTKFDIKNYLEKIYNIPIVDVRTRIALGKFRRDVGKGYVIKDDDVKTAYVVLPKDMKFEYPNIFGTKKDDGQDEEKALSEAKKNFQNYIDRNKHRTDVPSWFTI